MVSNISGNRNGYLLIVSYELFQNCELSLILLTYPAFCHYNRDNAKKGNKLKYKKGKKSENIDATTNMEKRDWTPFGIGA